MKFVHPLWIIIPIIIICIIMFIPPHKNEKSLPIKTVMLQVSFGELSGIVVGGDKYHFDVRDSDTGDFYWIEKKEIYGTKFVEVSAEEGCGFADMEKEGKFFQNKYMKR